MGIGKVMGRARNALFSPPIDNGADAVGEAVATAAAGSSMCWLLLPLLVLLLILLPGLMVLHGWLLLLLLLVLHMLLVLYGYGCFCWPDSGTATGTGTGIGATGLTTGLTNGVGELDVEGESRCLIKLTRWWRRHFARLLENQTWLINRWRDNLLVDKKRDVGFTVCSSPELLTASSVCVVSRGVFELGSCCWYANNNVGSIDSPAPWPRSVPSGRPVSRGYSRRDSATCRTPSPAHPAAPDWRWCDCAGTSAGHCPATRCPRPRYLQW